MERSRNKQTGFSIVEALIAAFVVCALAGVSWAVYQHVKSSATTTGAEANPTQSSTQQTRGSTQPAPTVAYLTIKEWGIKLPLSDAIKDAYYVPSATNVDANGVPMTMWLGLTSLNASGCDATSVNTPGKQIVAVGALLRVAPTDEDHVSGVLFTKEYPGITIGNYYYAYKDDTSFRTCASATSLQSVGSAFTTAVTGASAVSVTIN